MQSSQGTSTGNTGTQDVTYDLVSIIFHALQGAETYDKYIQDAQQGNQEVAQFFSQIKEENSRRAQQAKQLLMRQLQQEQGGMGGGSGMGGSTGGSGMGGGMGSAGTGY